MNAFIRAIATGIAIAVSCAAFADETVYVQSFTTKLLAKPEFGAAVLAEAKRGDTLILMESKDRWTRVKFGARSGWVPSLTVSRRPPMRRDTVLDAAGGTDLPASARRRASGATTAGAARGLTYEDRLRADKAGIADYAAIDRMESLAVSEEEALAFVAGGLKK